MNVSITPELQLKVEELAKTGDYASSSEVVRDALRLFFEHRTARQQHLREMYADMAASIAQADAGELVDGADVIADARRRRAGRVEVQGEQLTP